MSPPESPRIPLLFLSRLLLLSLSLSVAVAAPGCAGNDHYDPAGTSKTGRGELARGDYETAVRLIESEIDATGGTEQQFEDLETARQLAARGRAGKALRALHKGHLREAETHLLRAERYAKNLPAVKRVRAEVEPRLEASREARRLRDEAKRVMEVNPTYAVELLALSREKDPDDVTTIALLQQATLRSEAERSLDDARYAWKNDNRTGTAVSLLGAQYRGKRVSGADAFVASIELELLAGVRSDAPAEARAAWEFAVRIGASPETLVALREAATERLLQEADLLLSAGRIATAAMLELDAGRMGVDRATPALDMVSHQASVVIVVFPFEDATGGSVDGLRVARMLADRLVEDARGGGLAVTVLGPGPESAEEAAARPQALLLRGRAIKSRIQRNRVGRSRETVEVRVGTRVEPGPDMEPLVEELNEVVDARTAAQRELAEARDELRRIVDMPYIHPTRGGRSRLGEQYYNELRRRAEVRVNQAAGAVEEARTAEVAVREQIRRAEGHVEIAVYEPRERLVTTFNHAADLSVEVTLTDADGTLMDQAVTGSFRHKETVAPGFPDGDVPEDPDEAPSDVELADAAAGHFASLTSGMVRRQGEKAARHFLVDARRAEAAGKDGDAAEFYAAYLLATPEIATAERARAAEAFEELTGVRVPLHTGYRGSPR